MRSEVSVLRKLRSRGKMTSHVQSSATLILRDQVGSLKRYTPRHISQARRPEIAHAKHFRDGRVATDGTQLSEDFETERLRGFALENARQD